MKMTNRIINTQQQAAAANQPQKRYYAVIALVNGVEVPQMWSALNLSLGSRVVNGVSCGFVRFVN